MLKLFVGSDSNTEAAYWIGFQYSVLVQQYHESIRHSKTHSRVLLYGNLLSSLFNLLPLDGMVFGEADSALGYDHLGPRICIQIALCATLMLSDLKSDFECNGHAPVRFAFH